MTLQQIVSIGYDKLRAIKALPRHIQVAAGKILVCRTAALGGHVWGCPEGHFDRILYNSCKHRSCPQCAYVARERWLDRQKARLLAGDHYHVIFTLPWELHDLWRANVGPMTELLFQAVRETLFELLRDAKYLGADPGLIMARHTWSQTLLLHPHLHCLVTGGGLTAEGQWKPVKNGYLLPGKVVRALFRGKFLDFTRKALERGELVVPAGQRLQAQLNLLNKLGRRKWNVCIRERYPHGTGVLQYLARDLRGAPMSARRIVAADEHEVTFRYRDSRKSKQTGQPETGTMRLPIEQFVGRLLQHVPLPGQRLVRAYGVYAGGRRADLDRCRAQLGQPGFEEPPKRLWQDCVAALGEDHPERCPICGVRLVVRGVLPATGQERPLKLPLRAAA